MLLLGKSYFRSSFYIYMAVYLFYFKITKKGRYKIRESKCIHKIANDAFTQHLDLLVTQSLIL